MTSCYALGHYFKKASELRHYQISASYPDDSLSVSMHVKEGAKEKKGLASSFFTFLWSLALRHQSLACHSRFVLASMRAQNEEEEEKEAPFHCFRTSRSLLWPLKWNTRVTIPNNREL